jgi:DNA-binding SARP family transcriptional activator
MATQWRIEMFGGLRVQRLPQLQPDEQVATAPEVLDRFRSRQSGALLAYLAYFPRPHARELLCELLWPGHDAALSRKHLRVVLSSLRKGLEPPDVPAGSVLVTDRNFVQLDPQSVTTDVAEFEATLQQAAQTSNRAAQMTHLAQAVEGYHGVLLPGFYEEWIVPESQRVEESYFVALRRLIHQLEQDGETERALHYARRGLSMDALREDVGRDVMRLYAATGQPALALRQYREMERALKSELNTVPAPQTRELMRLIESESNGATVQGPLSQGTADTTLSATHPTTPSPLAPDAKTKAAQAITGAAVHSSYLPPQWTRFFGRRTEINDLQKLWSDPNVRLVTLTGPGGSGKTRLGLETARLWREEWQPEITLWFVPLAEVSQPESLAVAIVEVVGGAELWPGSGPNSALERLLPALQEVARPVLVLDNLEHLLPAGAALVQTLLQRVPALKIPGNISPPVGDCRGSSPRRAVDAGPTARYAAGKAVGLGKYPTFSRPGATGVSRFSNFPAQCDYRSPLVRAAGRLAARHRVLRGSGCQICALANVAALGTSPRLFDSHFGEQCAAAPFNFTSDAQVELRIVMARVTAVFRGTERFSGRRHGGSRRYRYRSTARRTFSRSVACGFSDQIGR